MTTRGAQWAFAVLYLIVALVAVWGGMNQLNPPPPQPSDFDGDPLPLLVNSGMITAAMFYFLTAAAFMAATAYAARGAMRQTPQGLVAGLNIAFAAALLVIAAYLTWYGIQLLMLGGTFAYALSGVALLAVVYFLEQIPFKLHHSRHGGSTRGLRLG